jgi:hypothetical protein
MMVTHYRLGHDPFRNKWMCRYERAWLGVSTYRRTNKIVNHHC